MRLEVITMVGNRAAKDKLIMHSAKGIEYARDECRSVAAEERCWKL